MSCTCNKLYKPKFRRQVDRIYPGDPKVEKPIRSEMDKLVYYSMAHPEKLDRLGSYLSDILEDAIYKKQNGWTKISIDAIEALLKACQAPQINLFVQSYMNMCRMLLESENAKARKWGASAFVSFCDVDEEGNHERSYNAFIDLFCKFCHEDGKNKEDVKTIRLCGIDGLQGVVIKMSKTKMGERLIAESSKKIIPSLLYNMNDSLDAGQTGPGSLRYKAEEVIRELLSIAVLSQIDIIVKPLLKHCDHHQLWETESSIVWAELFMKSVRLSYSHYIVKLIMEHTEHKDFESEKGLLKKRGILNCISQISKIPKSSTMSTIAGELLQFIIRGLEKHGDHVQLTEQYTSTCGAIIGHLESVVQVELIRSMIHALSGAKRREALLSAIHYSLSFCDVSRQNEYNIQSDIVNPIIHVTAPLMAKSTPEERQIITKIVIYCLDYSQNAPALNRSGSYHNGEIHMAKMGSVHLRQDASDISVWLLENLSQPKNTTHNYLLYYQLMGVLICELGEEILTQIIRLLLAFQDKITTTDTLRHQAHACVGATFALLASLFIDLQPVVSPILTERRNHRPQLAPEALFSSSSDALRRSTANLFAEDNSEKYLFRRSEICAKLKNAGFDTSSISDPLGNLDELSAVSSRSRELDTESIHLTVHDQEDKPLLTDDNSNTTSIKGLLALLKDAPKGKEERKLMLQKQQAELQKLDFNQMVARLEKTRKRDSELMQRIMEHSEAVQERGFMQDYKPADSQLGSPPFFMY